VWRRFSSSCYLPGYAIKVKRTHLPATLCLVRCVEEVLQVREDEGPEEAVPIPPGA